MRRIIFALASSVVLVGAPAAAAQPEQPPPRQGCNVVFVSVGAVDVSLLRTVNVHTPGTSLSVDLAGVAGGLVCGVIGGGGGTVPAPPGGG